MGNRIGSTGAEEGAAGEGGNFGFNTRRRYQQHKREYCLQNEYRSKTLPARPTPLQPQKQSHPQTRLGSSSCLGGGQNTSSNNNSSTPPHNGETSRVLFLLYLIHRTWNVVMDTMDSRTKSRSPRGSTPQKETPVELELQERNLDEECSIGITDMDASSFCSQYSCCSCSYCDEGTEGTPTNVYSSIGDDYSLDSMFDAAKSVNER